MGNYKAFGRPVHSPLAKLLVILTLLVWLPLTLPLHVLVWLFNGRGFVKTRGDGYGGKRYDYEPPAWAAYSSLIAAVAALIVLL